jgi:hypothetical protein
MKAHFLCILKGRELFTVDVAGMITQVVMFRYKKIPSFFVCSILSSLGNGLSESGWMCGAT